MKKHVVAGAIVGLIFCGTIVWGAAYSAYGAGGPVLVSTLIAGLLAGLCIGVLIFANFAILDLEENGAHRSEEKEKARAAA